MSKFKSFASQSSFRDYQLQVPDESAKIKEETARTIRGKERAENFRRGNAEIYLQAQKLVQGLEAQNREQNFQLETENRKAFIDQLNEEYQLRVQSDNQRLAAQQRDLQNIAQFSKTAIQLYGQFEKIKTDNQTKENAARVYRAGADYNTVVAIKGLSNNLTKAELAQQDFIRDKLKEGGNIDAYYELYKNRHTRGFINNIAVAQAAGRAYNGAANKFLEDFQKNNPKATAAETKLAFNAWTNTYVAEIAPELNANLLNDTTFTSVRQAETAILGGLDTLIKKEREESVLTDTYKSLNTDWDAGGGVDGFHEKFHTTRPSAEKREISANWIIARLKAGTMSPDDALAIVQKEYVRSDGYSTSWQKQFPNSENVAKILEAVREQRRTAVGEVDLSNKERAISADQQAEAILNESLAAGNGFVSPEAIAQIERVVEEVAPIDYESPVLEKARTLTLRARYAVQAKEKGLKLAETGSLTVAYVNSIGNYEVQKELMPIAEQQEKIKGGDNFKSYIGLLKSEIVKPPGIMHAPLTGVKNSTVLRYQHEAEQQFRRLIFQNNFTPEQAFGQVLGEIQAEIKREGAIVNGNYTKMLAEMESETVKGQQAVEFRKNFTAAAQTKQMRTDAYYAVNSYGQDRFYKDYYAMQRGESPSTDLKFAAGRLFMSPIETMNFFASGLSQPPIPLNVQAQAMLENIKLSTKSNYNATYSTNAMRGRANLQNTGLIAQGAAPTRFGGPATPLSSYAPQVASIVMEADDGQPGMDIFFEDKKFPAVLPGVVKEIGWQGSEQAGYGNYVVIESTDPATGQKVDVLYSHLEMPTHLPEGSEVMPGQIIGKQGGTGSVESVDGTIASIDFLAPAVKGSKSMVPYRYFKELRERIATQLSQ